MFKHKTFLIQTLTNTHVGSGDTSYGIVDNMIQKDTTTSIPIIHSSSLKGAVRDHFEQFKADKKSLPKDSDLMKLTTFEAIFGGGEPDSYEKIKKDVKDSQENGESLKDEEKNLELLKKAPRHGLVKFYEARLLTLPLRSTIDVFFHATSPSVALDYLRSFELFKVEDVDINKIKILIEFFEHLQNHIIRNDCQSEFVVFTNRKPIIEDFENCGLAPKKAKDGKDFISNKIWNENIQYDDVRKLIKKYLIPALSNATMSNLAIFNDDI